MAIRAKNVIQTDKDGKQVDPTATKESAAFALIPAGFSTAIITKMGENEPFKMSSGLHISVTPNVRLLNDNGTVINRQQFIVGMIDSENNIITPAGKDTVWGGLRGARSLLQALKMYSKDEESGEVSLTLDAPTVINMVVRVGTSIGAYREDEYDTEPNKLQELLSDVSGEQVSMDNIEQVKAALALLNEGEERPYKLKNMITTFSPVSRSAAEKAGYYVADSGQVFVAESDYFASLDVAGLEDSF